MKGRNYDYKGAYQGQMVKNRLETISRLANTLQSQIQPNDQLPQWTINKIVTAEDRLNTSMQYLMSRMALQDDMQQFNPQTGFIDFFSDSDEVRLGKQIGGLSGLISGYILVHRVPALKKLSTIRKFFLYSSIALTGRLIGKQIGKQFE